MATESKPLKIIISESTRPIIENIEGKNSSLFSELYDKTFSCIENYLNAVGYGENQEGRSQENIVKTDSPNNIIAFIGERGSGKTSCMLSVAEMLQNKKDGNALKKYEVLNATKFVSVNVIEPSFINDKANVLELVVATLFRNFKEKVEKNAEHIDVKKKHTLLEAFQKVQENMKCLKNGTTELDTIDSLLQLSSGVDLKENMRTLVNAYLEFMNGSQQSILLLPIDDIDLNTKYAYDMVEQIRKYLILPNVLILVSLKLDQLEQVLRNDFTKQFESSLKNKQNEIPLFADIQQMAERYVQKLIPLEHRIFMPDMEAAMDKPYIVFNSAEDAKKTEITGGEREETKNNYAETDNKNNTDEENGGKKEVDESKFLKHQILAEIFKKTRFLFYNTKGKASYIIPRNLREFRNLVSLLHDLPDYKGDDYGNCYNKTIFKKYFYETWCENNLSVEKNFLFSQIISVQDAVNINATVLHVLKQIFPKEILEELQGLDDYKYILSEKNYKWNMSLGDVMAVLNYYESHTASKDDLKFVFAVKTHYSMKLYEYYDELTSNPIQKLYNNQETSDGDNLTKQIIRKDNLYGHSNYVKLVGGSFHTHTDAFKIIPPQKNNELRAQRQINFGWIKTLIKEINEFSLNEHGAKFQQELTKIRYKIQLVEFFVLLTSRRCDVKNLNKANFYREVNEVYYSADLSSLKKNAWFDVLSCLFNCINIQETYNRVDPSLFEKITAIDSWEGDNKSLYHQFKEKAVEYRPDLSEDQHKFYSIFAIRNIEILDHLIANFITSRNDGGTDAPDAYKQFFYILSTVNLSTYDVDKEHEKYHRISFDIYQVFYNFLQQVSSDSNTDLKENFSKAFMSPKMIIELKNFQKDEKKGASIMEDILEINDNYIYKEALEIKLQEKFTSGKYKKNDADSILKEIKKELEAQN